MSVKPTFFKDFPFALYFIYSELMTNGAIDANEEEFQGTTSISSANYALDVTKIQHVNRYQLQEVGTTYNANSDLIKVKINIL